MFLLCACSSDEQIEGGWGMGGAAEHLTSGMLHLYEHSHAFIKYRLHHEGEVST